MGDRGFKCDYYYFLQICIMHDGKYIHIQIHRMLRDLFQVYLLLTHIMPKTCQNFDLLKKYLPNCRKDHNKQKYMQNCVYFSSE
jgi:hypothetical protein